MNKSVLKTIFSVLAASILLYSCDDDENVPLPSPVTDQSFTQSFDDMNAAIAQGWVFTNLSDDPNGGWESATATPNGFTPFDGSRLLYSDYTAANNVDGNISNWAISPARIIQNGDKITFYTLSHGTVGYGANGSYGDRLQLRLATLGAADSIGEASTDLGFFTTPLLDINPLYKTSPPGDYPSTWTKYEATVYGLNKPDSGRFAFRYFVELHGGANGDELAIDKVEYISASHP